MYQLNVAQMSCGHCVASVTKAVQKIDAGAEVHVDLAQGRVSVTSSASLDAIAAAIVDAGYPVLDQQVV